MKIRYGFVSNSSSSSFIVKKEGLTDFQKHVIRHNVKVACEQSWDIQENETEFLCDTMMNNFPLIDFLEMFGIKAYDMWEK